MISKLLEQATPRQLLLAAVILAGIPVLAVVAFKNQLYVIFDTPSYLVFHNASEFFSIMVSFSIFGLGWYAYDQNRNRHALFLSVAFLAIGLIDFMHTLGYPGMPPLITPNTPNKSTQLWIAVRFFGALAFVTSAFIYPQNSSRWLTKGALLAMALTLSAAVFAGVTFFPDRLPTTYLEGVGLTPFKVVAEYLIITLLALALLFYWRRLTSSGDRLINYYLAGFVFCIFSELVFALYKSSFDTYNLLGHFYKFFAFLLIYRGIFVSSVRHPYEELLVSTEAVRQHRNMLSNIMDSVPQSIFWKDRESVYLGCNQVFARQAGLDTPEAVVGKTDFDLPWGKESSEAYRADDREVLETAQAKLHIVEKLNQSDGTTIWIDTTKIPLLDHSGKAYGVLGVYEDITKRKQIEEELQLQAAMLAQEVAERQKTEAALLIAKDAAEAANKAKSLFLANMSHELRTPLNGVIGMAQLLTMTDVTKQQQQYLDTLRLSANNLLSLIRDILDITKIEADQILLASREFSLRDCLDDVAETHRGNAILKGLALSVAIDASIPELLTGDRTRVAQVVSNLLSNAIKFTEQGSIQVAATVKDRTESTILLDLSVSDTGIGIDPAQTAHIFSLFTQADDSFTRTHGGAGLGLAISRKLAELMGGSITVESVPHQGSTFHFLLPCTVPSRPVPSYHSPDQPLEQTRPLTVLLAEDNKANQVYAQKVLELLGHRVTVTEDGQQALEAWRQGQFDLVLMDIQMPEIHGDEVVKLIRQQEQGGHVPIIAVTAHAITGDRDRLLQAGCDGYVAKPFQLHTLAAEIKRVIEPTA